jgi:hypothetical protein
MTPHSKKHETLNSNNIHLHDKKEEEIKGFWRDDGRIENVIVVMKYHICSRT